MPLQIGQLLYGYCGGIFGRDSYSNKRVEAVGFDWIVVRGEKGVPDFTCGLGNLVALEKFTKEVKSDAGYDF